MRELLELCRQLRYQDSRARAAAREARDEAHRHASAKTLLLRGTRACMDPSAISEHLPKDMWALGRRWTRKVTHGIRGTVRRIREGATALDDPVWTSDFIHGLKLSGALERLPKGRGLTWRLRGAERRGIEQDLREMPWWHVMGEERLYGNGRGHGRRREIRICQFAAALVPPKDKLGAGVVAGLLAGAVHATDEHGGACISVRRSEEAENLLGFWTIRFSPFGSRRLRLSPFYAAVFSLRMPRHVKEQILSIGKPADCPLLPVAMWQMALKGVARGSGMPFGNALPWGRKGRLWAWRHGCPLKGMRRLALDRWGLTCVYSGLREEMLAWYRRAEGGRSRASQEAAARIQGIRPEDGPTPGHE